MGKVFKSLLLVAAYTLALTLAIRFLLENTLDITLLAKYWYRDFVGNLVISLICLGLTHSPMRSILLSTIVITLLQLSNALKLAILGTPISPDDFINVKNLFILWDGVLLWALIALAVLPALLILFLTRWRRPLSWLTLSIVAASVPLGVLYSAELKSTLDKRFGNSVWNQPENFRKRGLGLHIVQETVRTISKVGDIPSEEAVASVNIDLSFIQPEIPDNPKRNLHMIVLESFFDPNSLGQEWVPEDPFPPEFTQLWDSTGRSQILAPVFGGYTANAEFESLCGFPVTENAVFFEGWLRRSAPCLPEVLSAAGYQSIASHPNVGGFWNRTHAYNLIGFDEYWNKTHFDTSDAVGNFVLDHSFFEQVFDRLEERDERPIFNYMLTLFGHLPYPLNDYYPAVIKTGKESKLLQGYLNHLYYKTRDLMAMLEKLRAQDPTALIVIFGDHLPNLGNNYGVYTDTGKMMADRDEFKPEMFKFLASTPLIVIDGEKGVLKTGDIPMYRLPALILSLLKSNATGAFDWTANPPDKIVRPIYGMHFYMANGKATVCRPDNPSEGNCAETTRWLDDVKTLSADIFTGKQFSLEKWKKRAQ